MQKIILNYIFNIIRRKIIMKKSTLLNLPFQTNKFNQNGAQLKPRQSINELFCRTSNFKDSKFENNILTQSSNKNSKEIFRSRNIRQRALTEIQDSKSISTSKQNIHKSFSIVRNNKEPQQSPLKIKKNFNIRRNLTYIKKNTTNLTKEEQRVYIQQGKHSSKQYGYLKAFAANTHKGLYRSSNQDKLSMVLNLPCLKKNVHYFGIFDGHGGVRCAEFVTSNLYTEITQMIQKQEDIQKIIKNSFEITQQKFTNQFKNRYPLQNSGSCALIALMVQDYIYIANLGDSRALLINNNEVIQITEDHKPSALKQKQRIKCAGGRVYQTESNGQDGIQKKLGPVRVWPGRLSVSRAFGDIQAKLQEFGGLKNVISTIPDIYKLKIIPGSTIILACDGIYDRLENEKIKQIFSSHNQDSQKNPRDAIKNCFLQAFKRDTFDNVSMISLSF